VASLQRLDQATPALAIMKEVVPGNLGHSELRLEEGLLTAADVGHASDAAAGRTAPGVGAQGAPTVRLSSGGEI
jgi:hypothetical protein